MMGRLTMPRRPASFTKADVARAVGGAVKAGLAVHRIEIDAQGKIVVICTDAPQAVPQPLADAFEERLRSARGWEA
jgi:hypothetical protein